MPRYFTLEQATRMLPQVEEQLLQALKLKQEAARAEEALRAVNVRVAVMGGVNVDREQFIAVRARRDATSMRLKEIIEAIQNMGCQVKDLDIGLVDFPTLYNGNEVLLCWRLGEDSIEYWHGLEEGYRGRKLIDDHFRQHHRGGSEA